MPEPALPTPSAAIGPGVVIAGKYRVDRVIGRGGMGVVVAAHHVQLDERVAIKVLLPEIIQHPEAVARFLREARATVKIRSEHVVRVLDAGELENGAPYIVMEYLEGADLAARLAAGPIHAEEAVDYVLQACEALAEAHKGGIIHRDLKPANLFISARADGSPLVKVLDFGISKAIGGDAGLTRTAVFMGSAHYAPPEQLLSAKDADVRSDVWALGVILYEAIAGEVPFGGESVMEVAARVMQVAPKDLATLRPDSPPGLAPIIMTCLEKRPEARYPDIKALARALAPFSPRSALSVERISKLLGERSDVSGVAATVAGQAAGGAPPAGASSGTVPLAPPIRNQGGTIRGHSVSVGPHPRARWIAGGRWAAALAAVMGLGVLVALSFSRRASAPREVAASLSMQPPVPTGSRANGDPSAGMDPDPPAPSAAPSTTAPPSATAAAVPPPAAAVVKHASASAAHAAPPPSPDPTESASPKRNPLHVEAK